MRHAETEARDLAVRPGALVVDEIEIDPEHVAQIERVRQTCFAGAAYSTVIIGLALYGAQALEAAQDVIGV